MAMDIILKVQPDLLTSKAGELNNEKSSIQNITEQIKQEINSMAGVWMSDAADVYQQKFKTVYKDIESVLAIVSEHVGDINDVAQIYTAAENAAKGQADGLPTDGVFR